MHGQRQQPSPTAGMAGVLSQLSILQLHSADHGQRLTALEQQQLSTAQQVSMHGGRLAAAEDQLAVHRENWQLLAEV